MDTCARRFWLPFPGNFRVLAVMKVNALREGQLCCVSFFFNKDAAVTAAKSQAFRGTQPIAQNLLDGHSHISNESRVNTHKALFIIIIILFGICVRRRRRARTFVRRKVFVSFRVCDEGTQHPDVVAADTGGARAGVSACCWWFCCNARVILCQKDVLTRPKPRQGPR